MEIINNLSKKTNKKIQDIITNRSTIIMNLKKTISEIKTFVLKAISLLRKLKQQKTPR